MVAVVRKFPPHGEDMASRESIISVRGINKVYPGQIHALKDVDLDFPAGALPTSICRKSRFETLTFMAANAWGG